jgi:hypothetical protein
MKAPHTPQNSVVIVANTNQSRFFMNTNLGAVQIENPQQP